MCGVPKFTSSICHMLELGDNGTLSCQWEYSIEHLPLAFHFLDAWTIFHLTLPVINEFYDPEYAMIHCKINSEPKRFSPILVEIYLSVTGIHHKCHISTASIISHLDFNRIPPSQTSAGVLSMEGFSS